MERTITLQVDVVEEIGDDEAMYAVQKVLNQIEKFDGFNNPEVISVSGLSAPEESELEEVQALLNILDSIDADDHNLAEKLEQAQGMAVKMMNDDTVMEIDEDE